METELLASFRAGRPEALERIYRENAEAIQALVQTRLRRSGHFSPANAADLVQEIFTKAFSSRARLAYDGVRAYGPFLRQLASNTLIDWLRTQGREIAGALDIDALAETHLTTHASTTRFPPEAIAITRRFIHELPPELRRVHEQRFLAAESQGAAAQALGISRQTLRTLERRLLDRLRLQLDDFG